MPAAYVPEEHLYRCPDCGWVGPSIEVEWLWNVDDGNGGDEYPVHPGGCIWALDDAAFDAVFAPKDTP